MFNSSSFLGSGFQVQRLLTAGSNRFKVSGVPQEADQQTYDRMGNLMILNVFGFVILTPET
jgi:hypothetical protein